MQNQMYAAVEADLAWAASHVDYDTVELWRDLPWARLFRLGRGERAAWLKIVGKESGALVGRIAGIARAFPDVTPEVIAGDTDRGALLFADHQGAMLPDQLEPQMVARLLETYATIQSRAARDDDLVSSLPPAGVNGIVDRLLDFLDAIDRTASGECAAARFIGRDAARAYHAALSICRAPLEALIEGAAALAPTLCHGDLRPANAAIRGDGSFVLFDWDDAKAGPPGMSLHSLLGGAAPAIGFLGLGAGEDRLDEPSPQAYILRAYIDRLAHEGYGERAAILRALPGALTVGVIDHVLTFGKFPPRHDETTDAAAQTIHRELTDLLDLCGLLATQDHDIAATLAAHYAGTGAVQRAIPLLETLLGAGNGPPPGMDAAINRSINPARARAGLAIAEEVGALWAAAEAPDTVPRVPFSADDMRDPEFFAAKQELALRLFQRYGVLMIENAFAVDTIDACREAFLGKYERYFTDRDHEDALRVGDKRFMVTVDVEGPFNKPAIYGSPVVYPLLQRILGQDAIIGSFNVIASLPGSKDQGAHQDHPALFPEAGDMPTPDFAVNMIVPLVPLDEVVGTTCIIKGSQNLPKETALTMPRQLPMAPLGSCLLLSYRMTHYGLGNRSNRVRPILSLNYHRAWFRDEVNHERQRPVAISAQELVRVPPALQHLFSWMKSDP